MSERKKQIGKQINTARLKQRDKKTNRGKEKQEYERKITIEKKKQPSKYIKLSLPLSYLSYLFLSLTLVISHPSFGYQKFSLSPNLRNRANEPLNEAPNPLKRNHKEPKPNRESEATSMLQKKNYTKNNSLLLIKTTETFDLKRTANARVV